MSSSSNFGFTDEEIVYELASFLHSSILDILGYGIYTSIYFVAVYLILSQQTERPRIGSVVLITIMWIFVTIHVSLRWAKLNYIYIRHGETRKAQLEALAFSTFYEFFLQYVADAAVTFISLLLADITMIWRCWILYSRKWLVILIPGLSLVTGSVCYVWRLILILTSDYESPRKTDQVADLELAFLSTTVLTNIFCTTAIVYRPIRVSGWRKAAKTYHKIVEILIESSILYTAVYVIRIGLQIHTQYFTEDLDERLFFAQAMGFSITGIAPTLIIACLAVSQTPTRPAKTPTRTSNLPPMKSTIGYFAESQTQPEQRATSRTVEDVDFERSCFEEDSDGHAGDYSRPADSAASGERSTGRGRVPLTAEVPV